MRSLNRLHSPCAFALASLVLVVLTVSAPRSHAEDENPTQGAPIFLKWSTGFDFSRGDYGLDEPTTLFYVPFSVALDYRRFRAKIFMPFLASSGPTQIDTNETVLETSERRGFGQLQVAASYLFDPPAVGLPYFELGAGVSAPTETRRELGTGHWSLEIHADLFRQFGHITPFLSAGRKFYLPCDCDRGLDDRFFASFGASYELSDIASIGIAYDWLAAARGDAEDSHEIVPFASFRLSDVWTVGPYAVVGLSDGSPDYGLGFSLSVRQ